MKLTTAVAAKLLLLALAATSPRNNSFAGSKQWKVSLNSGISMFTTKSSLDSVYFLKTGYNAAVQANYYWAGFGLTARAGYFSNSANMQSLQEFAKSRRTQREKMQISAGDYKSMYLLAGPAFKSEFNKWQLESSLEGGLTNKSFSQIAITDNLSPDIVYYRNVFDGGSSFAWAAGLSLSYAFTTKISLGINADYLNTRNNVVNYDIHRGNGREAKNISSAAGFLNAGLRLSYLFNSQNAARVRGYAERKKNNDTCKCENKLMEVQEMIPYVVEIQFTSIADAKKFLDTYQPLLERRGLPNDQAGAQGHQMKLSNVNSNPMYKDAGKGGNNALYQGKRESTAGTRPAQGIVQRNEKGEQVFYTIPSSIDIAGVLSLQDGRITVHIQSSGKGDNPNTMKAGVSTSRSNIPRASRKSMNAQEDNSFEYACEVELDGQIYQAQVILKTKHDTVKNSINNVR